MHLFAWLQPEQQDALAQWLAAYTDPRRAWRECPRPEWLLYALARSGADHRGVVRCAASCVTYALEHVPDIDPRAKRAHRAAVLWLSDRCDAPRVARCAAIAETALDEAPSMATFEACSAAIAAARLVESLSPFDAAAAAHGAVEAVALARSLYAAPQRIAADQARGRLLEQIFSARWPLRPPRETSLCRPALQVAYDLAQEHIPLTSLATVERLAAPSLRRGLEPLVSDVSPPEEALLCAIAEHLAASEPAQAALITEILARATICPGNLALVPAAGHIGAGGPPCVLSPR